MFGFYFGLCYGRYFYSVLTIMMSQVYVGKFKNSKGAIKILKTGSDAVLKYILLNF